MNKILFNFIIFTTRNLNLAVKLAR